MTPQTPISDLPRMADIKPITTKLKVFTPTPEERELYRHNEDCAVMKGKACDCLALHDVVPPIAEQGRIREQIMELTVEAAFCQQRLEMCERLIAHHKSLLREL